MGKWLRRGLIALIVLGAFAGAAYWWLIVESHVPSSGSYAIDMAEVRRLANSMPGDKAQEVRVERVASFAFPATAAVAGDGWNDVEVPIMSYQLVFPDRTVMIDTALNEDAVKGSDATFDRDAYARMAAAMEQTSLIVITHEHMDHIGGLATHPKLAQVLKVTQLNKEEVEHPERMVPIKFPAGALDGYQPLVYDRYHAVAPGVVLIRAAGHTPGSQMVFVPRADGTEYLFLGDVAWLKRNVDLVRQRARLVTDYMLNEDRDAVALQLAEIHRLSEAEPAIHIVPGHDRTVLDAALSEGWLVKGFK